jgi:micrococcal nuclease
MPNFRSLPLLFALLLGVELAGAAERVAGPVDGEIVKVIDGDTIEVKALIWPGLEVTVGARLRGIDAPEVRSACREEKMLAAAATDRLRELVGDGPVRLFNIEHDKFAGRVVVDVADAEGRNIAEAMVASGLARPYDGGGRAPWCPLASAGG